MLRKSFEEIWLIEARHSESNLLMYSPVLYVLVTLLRLTFSQRDLYLLELISHKKLKRQDLKTADKKRAKTLSKTPINIHWKQEWNSIPWATESDPGLGLFTGAEGWRKAAFQKLLAGERLHFVLCGLRYQISPVQGCVVAVLWISTDLVSVLFVKKWKPRGE